MNITPARLADVAQINPDTIGRDWPHTQIYYIDISSVGEGLIQVPPQPLALADAPSRAKRLIRSGDTVLSTVRPNRRSMFFADQPGSNWVVSTGFAVLRPQVHMIAPRFLYACVFSQSFTEYLISREKGAAYPAVSPEDIGNAVIPLPPLKEQRAIAHILGTLDDKIELNRRMNRTLEEMARAIFKSWFVDFDPVRAKADGRNTGLPAEIAALFPDSFEDSELGEIPKGWDATSFTDNIEVIGGGTPKTSKPEYWDGDIPWFSVVDTPADGEVFVISTKQTVTQSGIDNSSARILPVGTTIISARGTVGNLALVGVPMAMNQSCYGLKDQRGGAGYFLYFATEAVVDTLRQRGHGSVFNTITRDTLHGLRVASPPHEVMAEFERVVQGLMLQILSNQHKSRTLADIRDALLPKLISGKLRVPNAERILERAM
jgi:type I restriction enzyme S subunit